jgi:predicted DNA binding CopG/RHH family protein
LGINARIKIRLAAEGIPAVQVQQHAATYSGLDFQVMLTYGNTYLIFHE